MIIDWEQLPVKTEEKKPTGINTIDFSQLPVRREEPQERGFLKRAGEIKDTVFTAGVRYPRALFRGLERLQKGEEIGPLEAGLPPLLIKQIMRDVYSPVIDDPRDAKQISWDMADTLYGKRSTNIYWEQIKLAPFTTAGVVAEIKMNPAIMLAFQSVFSALKIPAIAKLVAKPIPAPKWLDDAVQSTIKSFYQPFDNLSKNVKENRINAIVNDIYKKFEPELPELKQAYVRNFGVEPTESDLKTLIKAKLIKESVYDATVLQLQKALARLKARKPLPTKESPMPETPQGTTTATTPFGKEITILQPTPKVMPQPTKLLAEQAVREGVSREEFVAQGKVLFRGGEGEGDSYSTWKSIAEDFAKNRGGVVSESVLSPNAKIANYSEVPNVKFKDITDDMLDARKDKLSFMEGELETEFKKAVEWAKEKGYDAIELPVEGEIRIINKGVIKTKADLTQSYDKAQAKLSLKEVAKGGETAQGTRPQDFDTAEEYVASKGKALFHGSNKELEGGLNIPQGHFKEGIAYATDDKDYAYQQGGKLHELYVTGKNELTPQSIEGIGRDRIYNALSKYSGGKLSKDVFANSLYPDIVENIKKYKDGEIPSERIFDGMGDVNILKELGFTHEIEKNPYDKTGDTSFYKIFQKDSVQTKAQLTQEFNDAKAAKAPQVTQPPPPDKPTAVSPGEPEFEEVSGFKKYRGKKLTPEEADKLNIANKLKKDGSKTPAVRQQSGIYAEKEFETFPFKDAGGKTDNLTSMAATADNIQEGEGFGPMYNLASQTYKTIADRNDFKTVFSSRITDLAQKHGFVKGTWGILDKKDGEIIFHLLDGKTPSEATDNHRAFAKEMRKIYDELRDLANDIRKKLGKPEIKYIKNYASHIRQVGLFQDILKEAQTSISENFDFIIPNEKKNPFAMKRLGEMADKETNFWRIIDGYIDAIASDIYISPTIEKLKAVGSVAEGRGLYNIKKFIDQYIRGNLLKKPDPIDNYTGMKQGSLLRKMTGKIINTRQLGALAGNIEWILFTQPMSLGNTMMKAGIPNTLNAMLKWFSPETRKSVMDFNVMRLKKKGGVVSTAAGDVDKITAKIYTSRVDKFNKFLGVIGDTVEYHLTGMSTQAGLEQGKKYGLTGKELEMYADYIGQVTQSVYNPEARMQLLNSMAVRGGFPFQSFAGEMFRHLRTLTNKGGGLPLSARQRLGHILNLITSIIIINAINQKARGRNLMTVGSFIPLVGGIVDETIARVYNAIMKRLGKPGERFQFYNKGPIAPFEDVKKLTRAIADVIEHGNWTRMRRELVFWGMGFSGIGGGLQLNKLIEGLVALEKGYVEDVRGRKLFEVKSWSALWRGPWGTPEGREHRRPKGVADWIKPEAFEKFSFPKALEIFEQATPEQREKVRDVLYRKFQRSRTKTPEQAERFRNVMRR